MDDRPEWEQDLAVGDVDETGDLRVSGAQLAAWRAQVGSSRVGYEPSSAADVHALAHGHALTFGCCARTSVR